MGKSLTVASLLPIIFQGNLLLMMDLMIIKLQLYQTGMHKADLEDTYFIINGKSTALIYDLMSNIQTHRNQQTLTSITIESLKLVSYFLLC